MPPSPPCRSPAAPFPLATAAAPSHGDPRRLHHAVAEVAGSGMLEDELLATVREQLALDEPAQLQPLLIGEQRRRTGRLVGVGDRREDHAASGNRQQMGGVAEPALLCVEVISKEGKHGAPQR